MAYQTLLPTVNNIDVEKYQGKWFEIARFDFYWEPKGDINVTAHYIWDKDTKTIAVVNQSTDRNGNQKKSVGTARAIDPSNAKLKVSFLPKWLCCFESCASGDYWILKIDKDYQTVLIGNPTRDYLWILHRKKTLDKKTVNEYKDYARTLGFLVDSKLSMTIQN